MKYFYRDGNGVQFQSLEKSITVLLKLQLKCDVLSNNVSYMSIMKIHADSICPLLGSRRPPAIK